MIGESEEPIQTNKHGTIFVNDRVQTKLNLSNSTYVVRILVSCYSKSII